MQSFEARGQEPSAPKLPGRSPAGQVELEARAKSRLEVDPDLCSINSDYQMLSDVLDFKALMDEPNFGIKRYKNATYKG